VSAKLSIPIFACWIVFDVMVGAKVHANEGKSLYTQRNCQICHGTRGCMPAQDGYPVVAGQNRTYLINQILDIRDGVRENGRSHLMRPLTTLLTDDEVKSIASYLSGETCTH
jgi:cytochrome c